MLRPPCELSSTESVRGVGDSTGELGCVEPATPCAGSADSPAQGMGQQVAAATSTAPSYQASLRAQPGGRGGAEKGAVRAWQGGGMRASDVRGKRGRQRQPQLTMGRWPSATRRGVPPPPTHTRRMLRAVRGTRSNGKDGKDVDRCSKAARLWEPHTPPLQPHSGSIATALAPPPPTRTAHHPPAFAAFLAAVFGRALALALVLGGADGASATKPPPLPPAKTPLPPALPRLSAAAWRPEGTRAGYPNAAPEVPAPAPCAPAAAAAGAGVAPAVPGCCCCCDSARPAAVGVAWPPVDAASAPACCDDGAAGDGALSAMALTMGVEKARRTGVAEGGGDGPSLMSGSGGTEL